MSTPVNLSVTPSLRSTSLAHRRVTSFVRRGKRERIEGLFRSRWGRKAVKAKETTQKATQLSGSALLQNFALTATPFVALRTRRRGTRQNVKVTFLPQERGQRKALIALASTRSNTGATSSPFNRRLRRQLEGLVRVETRNRSSAVTSTSANNSVRERRDEIHRQALRTIPQNANWRGLRK